MVSLATLDTFVAQAESAAAAADWVTVMMGGENLVLEMHRCQLVQSVHERCHEDRMAAKERLTVEERLTTTKGQVVCT